MSGSSQNIFSLTQITSKNGNAVKVERILNQTKIFAKPFATNLTTAGEISNL
jgi:hypothetical protein